MIKKILLLLTITIILNFTVKYDRYITIIDKIIKDSFLNVVALTNNTKNIDDDYKNQNNALKTEINELKKLLELKNINSTYKKKFATVINRGTIDYFEEITIDKGLKDGIKENMAVITSDGLLGKTIKVTNYTSMVKLITSSDIYNKISVNISTKEKNITGIITNYDNMTNSLTIEGITDMVNINEGDVVTTTGLSEIYPNGLLIGHVTRITKDNFDLAYILKVEPSCNFNNFNYIAVLDKLN